MSRTVILALALIAAGAADAAPKGPPPATPTGKPVDCIAIAAIGSTRVYDDRTIDFMTSGRTAYRNTLPNDCPGLGFEQSFSYRTSLSQLCSVDIITVLRHTGGLDHGASCGLGPFQPVTLLPPAR